MSWDKILEFDREFLDHVYSGYVDKDIQSGKETGVIKTAIFLSMETIVMTHEILIAFSLFLMRLACLAGERLII